MKKVILFVFLLTICGLINAQVECKTIAEIKSQNNKTKVLYTGTAKTTFYNGRNNGLFMEDETGGILLKGYTLAGKESVTDTLSSFVTDSMLVTNLVGIWEIGSTGTSSGLKIDNADKRKPIRTNGIAFEPKRVTMSELFANKDSYSGCAIVVIDAKISRKISNKYYMNNIEDSIPFYSSNISTYAPAGGEMAGVYVGLDYNRFLLCSAELTKATEFWSFLDMASYFKGKLCNVEEITIDGAILVNYVAQLIGGETAIFAQYKGVTGKRNDGVVIVVEGSIDVKSGDSIKGFCGRFVDAYKHIADDKIFKGASFLQSRDKNLIICNSNNDISIVSDVNISDLISSKTALNYSSQIIASRYKGNLYSVEDEFYFSVSYEISNPDESIDGMIQKKDSIRVVGTNGLDLKPLCGSGVILSGVYDACVLYPEKPTIIVRNANDVLRDSYSYENIAELIDAGEPLSANVVYELSGEVIVNYKRTQVNEGVSQTWMFIEDESGVLAVDLGVDKVDVKVGDKIRGVKGTFSAGYRYGTELYHAPKLQIVNSSSIEVISSDNELNIIKASLKDVLQDTLGYCSHIVEISNVGGASRTITDNLGTAEDYYLYDVTDVAYEMHYQPKIHTGNPIIGETYILTGLVNFNCLDGYYVVYRISLVDASTVGVENNESIGANVYAKDGVLYIESCGGQSIDVYTVDGQKIYTTSNSSNSTEIKSLSGVVIVKIDGVTSKILMN